MKNAERRKRSAPEAKLTVKYTLRVPVIDRAVSPSPASVPGYEALMMGLMNRSSNSFDIRDQLPWLLLSTHHGASRGCPVVSLIGSEEAPAASSRFARKPKRISPLPVSILLGHFVALLAFKFPGLFNRNQLVQLICKSATLYRL